MPIVIYTYTQDVLPDFDILIIIAIVIRTRKYLRQI